MSTRIRYKETSSGIFESLKVYKSERGVPYLVRLNLNEMTYVIKNLYSEHLIKGGSPVNNLNVLKRNARDHLVSLGVDMKTETRDRTFGLCPKGYTQDIHEKE